MIQCANMMLQCMTLSVEATSEITSVNGQGMSYIEDFSEMDKDGNTLMFKSISRPGGFDANGNWNAGLKVSTQAQIKFGDMCFF